jgi:hypothetical protein
MIVNQSPLAGLAELPSSNQRATIGKSSPGGSNERSECHFACCSDVETGEGELYHRGHQSALIWQQREFVLIRAIRVKAFCPFKAFYEILRLFKTI